jgi:hypothetical protein
MESATLARSSDIDVAQLYEALLKLRDGDFSARLPADWKNRAGMAARVFNSLAEMMEQFAAENVRVCEEIGTKGLLGCTAEVFGIYGKWREMQDALNRMSIGLTVELRKTSQFAQMLAQDQQPAKLESQYIAGEVAELQTRLNTISDRLNATDGG